MRTEPSQLNVHYHVIASEADFSIDASFINYVLIDVVHTKKKRRECQCIGGSKAHAPPPWDPILSFSHTFSPKSAHVEVHAPHYGKSWIRHCSVLIKVIVDCHPIVCISWIRSNIVAANINNTTYWS